MEKGTTLSDLPSGLHCITIARILDDPDAVEQYLQYYPVETEKCLPLALRDVLAPLAPLPRFGEEGKFLIPPMPIPSAEKTLYILKSIWDLANAVPAGDFANSDVLYGVWRSVAEHDLAYLVPFLLNITQTKYEMHPTTIITRFARLPIAANRSHIDTVRALILLGADDYSKKQALDQAVGNCGNTDVVDLLLADALRSRPVERVGYDAGPIEKMHITTALASAAESGCIDVAKVLLKYGADINGIGAHNIGNTPLAVAASTGKTEMMKFLLDAKANVSADSDGALETASAYGQIPAIHLLLDAKANVTHDSLIAAARDNQPEAIKLLVAHGADIHANGDDALTTAVTSGGEHGDQGQSIDAVRTLLELRADVNAISDEDILDNGADMIQLFAQYGRHVQREE